MLAGHAHVPAQVASILLQKYLVQGSSVSLDAHQTCRMNTPVIGALHCTRVFSQNTGSAHAVVSMHNEHGWQASLAARLGETWDVAILTTFKCDPDYGLPDRRPEALKGSCLHEMHIVCMF